MEKKDKKGSNNPNPFYPSLNSMNETLQQPKHKKSERKNKPLKLMLMSL